ncbi:MAG: uracil-DNA glycosylase [Sphingobium sp.]
MTDTGVVRAQLDGLLSWWATAGVDGVVADESCNWLKPPPPRAPRADFLPARGDAREAAQGNAATPPTPAKPAQSWPDTLDAFQACLAGADDLPECRWPGRRFLPTGPAQRPRLMIVLPAPDADAGPDAPMGAAAMRLLGNMLRAVDLDLADCHLASLSLIAPPGGMIDSDLIAPLLRRMRHHIGLVAPQALLLAGDQTNRAFAPITDGDKAKNLPFVNHDTGNVPCASLLHPRLILEQPSAKAGAWKALRALIRG